MNVDAAYTIEINGTKHTLTHAEAKELHRKLGVFLGNQWSEIGRYGNGPYSVPCSNPDGPWKQTPLMYGGNEKPEAVLAPVGIPFTPSVDAASAIHFTPCSSDVSGATGFCNKLSGSSHTTT